MIEYNQVGRADVCIEQFSNKLVWGLVVGGATVPWVHYTYKRCGDANLRVWRKQFARPNRLRKLKITADAVCIDTASVAHSKLIRYGSHDLVFCMLLYCSYSLDYREDACPSG